MERFNKITEQFKEDHPDVFPLQDGDIVPIVLHDAVIILELGEDTLSIQVIEAQPYIVNDYLMEKV